jgi:hypothetical protein
MLNDNESFEVPQENQFVLKQKIGTREEQYEVYNAL